MLFSHLTSHTVSQYGVVYLITNFQRYLLYKNDVFVSCSEQNSGVTKGPADPAVQGGGGGGGAVLGGRQIVVWMWDNFENLTKVLAKLCVLL